TITANNQSMTFGGPLPALTASYSGFVNGDTAASLTTPLSLMTTATVTSPAGSYPINASGAVDSDYTITHKPRGLTIATPSGSVYVLDGSASGALTVSGNGVLNVPGKVYVESSSSSAVVGSGNGQMTAGGGLYVLGGVSWSSSGTKPTDIGNPPAGDP